MSQDFRLYSSAEVWDQEMQLGQKRLLQALSDFWPKGVLNALDVGCGDGKLTRVLAAKTGSEIVGFDSSAEALQRLTLRTVRGDAAEMPFADASFDLVLSTDTLEHVPDQSHEKVWTEIFRVARSHVMVAVPFREELLDATARCSQCTKTYHVNWHQRSYDIDDLRRQAPDGWHVQAYVMTGEKWPDVLPAETRLRRIGMDQWSGWSMAICPHCGAAGHEPSPHPYLPALSTAALGLEIYASLNKQRIWRSHSEILCIYGKSSIYAAPSLPKSKVMKRSASVVELAEQQVYDQLVSYPQVARCVNSVGGGLVIQFPTYGISQDFHVQRVQEASDTGLDASIEDGLGLLFSGQLLAPGVTNVTLRLDRPPVPGLYGVIFKTNSVEAIVKAALGDGPIVSWTKPDDKAATTYHHVSELDTSFWVQIAEETWLDDSFWAPNESDETSILPRVLFGVERLAEIQKASLSHENLQAHVMLNAMGVDVENLRAERDALLQRTQESDRHAVELQNLRAERDALMLRAQEADRYAVELQNLRAERDALMLRADLADARGIHLQQDLSLLQTAYGELRAAFDGVQARPEYKLGEALRRHLENN